MHADQPSEAEVVTPPVPAPQGDAVPAQPPVRDPAAAPPNDTTPPALHSFPDYPE